MHKKWNIDPADIRDEEVCLKLTKKWTRAYAVQRQRTKGHEFFSKVAHNQTLHESDVPFAFSEGSTQAIKRKIRAQTIQRVPDGEVTTQFDKNSIEHVQTEFIFKNKVLTSEFDGKDMMKHLWRTFNMSYDYGYGCVRTGFEKDMDNDVRVSYTLIGWNDVYPSPDCHFIEEAEWYMIREYVSKSDLEALIDEDGEVYDSTYNADVIKYLVENDIKDGTDPRSVTLADKHHGTFPTESVEIRTLYKRGADEFKTYVPSVEAVLRVVKNYDPRKDVPVHFMILEPDPDFPLGCSSIMWTLAHQQAADTLWNTFYQTLLLAPQPPLMVFGNMTPGKIKMRPKTIWPMGTNPNNKIEKFPVETTTLTQYGSIMENISANMMKNLNVVDSTVASDANVMSYSGTPQGVEQQHLDKTITVNQYQKRVEIFFSEWANHALRSYINSMSGEVEITVDEYTRRRIWDIEMSVEAEKSIIDGDKITIDFDALSSDMLTFEVRTGSLIESEREVELRNIQEMLVPISQMIGQVSEANKPSFEDSLMQLMARLFELSDVDISAQVGSRFNEALMMQAMQQTMEAVMGQQQQINQLASVMGPEQQQALMAQDQMMAVQQGLPPEAIEQQMPPEAMEPSLPPAEVSAEFPAPEVGAVPAQAPIEQPMPL